MDRWEPVPVPLGDGRHDIGDDVRAAIVERLTSDWNRDPDLTPEKARQLAMWAAASVRALLHELGTLRDLASEDELMPEAEALMLDEMDTGPILVSDHSVALEFVRELASTACEGGCIANHPDEEPCIHCRAAQWLHSETKA
jgi:hypothetical protein